MRWLTAAVITVSLLTLASSPATAHKGRLPEDALTLVRQASAFLAQNPAMTGEVRERLEAALKSKKPQGVDLNKVADALRALEKQDIAAARRLLLTSIMPAGTPTPLLGQPPPAPSAISSVSPQPPAAQPPAPPSADVAIKAAEPVRVRFTGSTAEVAILAVALVLVGLGLTSLWRSREAVRS